MSRHERGSAASVAFEKEFSVEQNIVDGREESYILQLIHA